MRTYFYILFIVLTASIAEAQTTVSSCIAPDSVVAKYNDDADFLALQRILNTNSHHIDSAEIPQAWSDTIMHALLAVYNATSLPARDSVIEMYPIHHHHSLTLKPVSLSVYYDEPYLSQLQNGIFPTGYPDFDALIYKYYLHFVSVSSYRIAGRREVYFMSDSNLNIEALKDTFATVNASITDNSVMGSGDYIWDTVAADHITLTYSFGWGDCPSGCMWRHFWEFRVSYNCEVTYVRSYGDPLWGLGIPQTKQGQLKIFPNPAANDLNIKGLTSLTHYAIYNMYGQLVSSGDTRDWIDISEINPGNYCVQLRNEKAINVLEVYKKLIQATFEISIGCFTSASATISCIRSSSCIAASSSISSRSLSAT